MSIEEFADISNNMVPLNVNEVVVFREAQLDRRRHIDRHARTLRFGRNIPGEVRK